MALRETEGDRKPDAGSESGLIKAHQRLKAWQLAMTLVEDIYLLTRSFPATEKFGLATQLQRAAVSVPSNIAEGAARDSSREFRRYLVIARGSLAELETQLILASNLTYMTRTGGVWKRVNELYALLNGLIARHKAKVNQG